MICSIGNPKVPTHIYYIESNGFYSASFTKSNVKKSFQEENTWITNAKLINFNTILINDKYKVVYDSNFASDLIKEGIKPGGMINAKLKWASNKGYLYLLTEKSEFLSKIQKCADLYNKNPIKKPEVGKIYSTKTLNKYLYLGKAYTTKISSSKILTTSYHFKEKISTKKQRCPIWLKVNNFNFKLINSEFEKYPNSKYEFRTLIDNININNIKIVEEIGQVNVTIEDRNKLLEHLKHAFGIYFVDLLEKHKHMTGGYRDYFNPDSNYHYISHIVNLHPSKYVEVDIDKLKILS